MFELVVFALYGLSFSAVLLSLASLWKLSISDLPSRLTVLVAIGVSAIGLVFSIVCVVWQLLRL